MYKFVRLLKNNLKSAENQINFADLTNLYLNSNDFFQQMVARILILIWVQGHTPFYL